MWNWHLSCDNSKLCEAKAVAECPRMLKEVSQGGLIGYLKNGISIKNSCWHYKGSYYILKSHFIKITNIKKQGYLKILTQVLKV